MGSLKEAFRRIDVERRFPRYTGTGGHPNRNPIYKNPGARIKAEAERVSIRGEEREETITEALEETFNALASSTKPKDS